MLVNKSSLGAVFINLRTEFSKAFEAAPPLWSKTAMKILSSSARNDYSWLDSFPQMREWVGDKVVRSLSAHQYSVVNNDFEATVGVDRNDIDDDNLGMYGPRAKAAGFSAAQLPDEIVARLKNMAFSSACYDGQYFYDTDHPVGAATVSNRGTAALSASTEAAADASYGAARVAIMSFRDEEGRPMGLIPDLLEVPPALETTGRRLVEMDRLANDTPNPYAGTAKLLVNPWLTSSTAWFLHVTSRPLMPFIYQERKAPVFVEQTDMSADDVFSRKLFKFGAEARVAGGYGLWQLSYGSTGLA